MSNSENTPTRDPGLIVVGVDGSESSREALVWAANQARLTGSRLRVVLSWELPSLAYLSMLPEGVNFAKDATQALDQELADVLGPSADVVIEKVVTEGHPAPVLLDQSKDADLLVVGSRGRGQFAGMLLGSTSEHCVTHATCPVVVVRPQRDKRPEA